jgi:subtilisin family serine protease
MKRFITPLLLILCLSVPGLLAETAQISPAVKKTLSKNRGANQTVSAWVFFKDKGPIDVETELAKLKSQLTTKALQRRMRAQNKNGLLDIHDLPVYADYVRNITRLGSKLRQKSRWLNAVSVEATASQIEAIAQLTFVKKIDIVHLTQVPELSETAVTTPLSKSSKTNVLDYGPSETQNMQIKTNELHNQGFDGSGVVIAMLDAGYNNLSHESLQHLNIIDTWDFVNNDPNVDDEPGQMGSGSHGTYTLSTLAGFKPGKLIGPAYGATFLLYKTENTDWERNVEEDAWIAAAERADSLGADIISSSLGYWEFDPGEPRQYTWQDMDGNTAVITIGADIAASRGILVVNAAGNEGFVPEPQNSIGAPADGDSVLAIGAVNAGGTLASFSSRGPTADGRIKPDVCAMGVSTVCASAFSQTGYATVNGTSLACPLAAGAAALILQAHPGISNMQIIDALRNTASNAATPNRDYGWGIIDAAAASSYLLTGLDTQPEIAGSFELYPAFPNPFNPATNIKYRLTGSAEIKLTVYNILGQQIAVLFQGQQAPGTYTRTWEAKNIASGVYFISLEAAGIRKVQKAVFIK